MSTVLVVDVLEAECVYSWNTSVFGNVSLT